ncbi:unnamed protein product [Prorocentrum cordatum]|uniref:Uncharacterized protein n=1 Tax=Prorocentrum cordatum TaxID=2364126 RepID=A0ABN9U0M5_9DINO|nr:unnamed protein product [Polarella glacialis]
MKRPAAAAPAASEVRSAAGVSKRPATAEAAGGPLNISGNWSMTVMDTGQNFKYTWIHSPGSKSFEGNLVGTGVISQASLKGREVRWTVGDVCCSARLHGDGVSLVDGKYWKQGSKSMLGRFTGQRRGDLGRLGAGASGPPLAPRPGAGRVGQLAGQPAGQSFGQRMQAAKRQREADEMADFVVGGNGHEDDSDYGGGATEDSDDEEGDIQEEDDESSLDEGRLERMSGGARRRPASAGAPGRQAGRRW